MDNFFYLTEESVISISSVSFFDSSFLLEFLRSGLRVPGSLSISAEEMGGTVFVKPDPVVMRPPTKTRSSTAIKLEIRLP